MRHQATGACVRHGVLLCADVDRVRVMPSYVEIKPRRKREKPVADGCRLGLGQFCLLL